MFRANLQEEGSFDEAVKGCSGVFHVAASMEFEVPANEDIGITYFNFLSLLDQLEQMIIGNKTLLFVGFL